MAQEDFARSSLNSAEKILEQAVLVNNQAPEVFHLLGNVYTKKGKFKKAILAFERTLLLDPFHTEAAIALSSLYNDMGKYTEGASIYSKTKKRLEKLQPGFDPRINKQLAQKHAELGAFYMRYERFREAYHEFAKALNLEPENLQCTLQMAKCLFRIGDKEGALTLLRKTCEAYPKSVELKIQLGVCYHAQKRLKEAQREWQEAQALEPENKMANMYLSMLEPDTGSESATTN
ncbi:MAG: tetratricopeptide repeat protein [Proteobacteria bacterium]|nr:tetratricopeptide repeat protein [Pseudomonadota bacterium]NDG27677.1 tetratricopeptide repeat protein [Pseudomonadota bacterium]